MTVRARPAASGSCNIVPHLEAAGFEVDLKSFFDADYLPSLYAGSKPSSAIWRSYARRVRDLMQAKGRADLIWLEKEALPWVPSALEGRLMPSGIPVVSDFDDAVFHRYDMHRLKPVRTLLGRKFAHVMQNSACVFAGNAYSGGLRQGCRGRRDRDSCPPLLTRSTIG